MTIENEAAQAQNLRTKDTEGFEYIDPSQIKVKEGLDRFRSDMGKIQDLIDSLNKFGQMQPVVINREYDLIAGGRRLAACTLANRKVGVVFADTVDPLLMREMEVEENVQRKAFSPAEEILAVKALHDLKVEIHGEACSGREGGHRLEDTAKIIGKTRGSVATDLILADAIALFPELKKSKSKSDIKRAVAAMEKVETRGNKLKEYEAVVEKSSLPISFQHMDALDFMPTLENDSVDLLITDPPYGMEVFENVKDQSGFRYDDGADQALVLYRVLAEQSFRFCKDTAHAFVFTCPEHFYTVRTYFAEVGWDCFIRPMLWIKKVSGQAQCNAPLHWPASSYETILYARRINSRILQPGKVDWVETAPVSSGMKVHQAQKPVALLRELIARTSYPGAILADPFSGSASSLIAGLEEMLVVKGCEKGKEAYAAGCEMIAEYRTKKEQGV